jgi:peptidyl-prolyl cis-trans isomerase C
MNTFLRATAISIAIAAVSAINVAHAQASASTSQSRVNGVPINPVEVQAALKRLIAAGLKDSAETRELAKQEVLAREVFRQAALAQKLDQDPEVQQAMREARDGAMLMKYVQKNLNVPPVTDAEVRAEYDRMIGALGPNEYQAIVLQFPDVAVAQSATQPLSGRADLVEQLAPKYIRPGSVTANGELTWVAFKAPPAEGQTFGLPLSVANALLSLRPGESSNLIADRDAVYMVKLQAMRKTIVPAFDKAAPAVRNLLEVKARSKATNALIEKLTAAKVD